MIRLPSLSDLLEDFRALWRSNTIKAVLLGIAWLTLTHVGLPAGDAGLIADHMIAAGDYVILILIALARQQSAIAPIKLRTLRRRRRS